LSKKEVQKRYREKHKIKIQQYYINVLKPKRQTEDGKKKQKERDLKYRLLNPEKEKAKYKRYYNKHHERILKEKRESNKKRRPKLREWQRNKYKYDPIFKTITCLRNRLKKVLKKRNKFSHIDFLGCSKIELIVHLESQFKEGMTWENYGFYGWHIDHIIPLSKVNLNVEEDVKKVCHYTNLQPLWWHENLKKGNRT
jgi:hypothetical protein